MSLTRARRRPSASSPQTMVSFRSAWRACALVVLALGLLPVASAAASSSANTAALQVALKALHHYSGSIDGIKGPVTIRGVRESRRAHHLTVDGIAGPQTRRALGVRGRPSLGSRTMRHGERGWDVAAVQFLLKKRGFSPGSIDGGFGSGTYSAARRFQSARGLSVDGVVGPATLHALLHGSSGGGHTSGGGPISFYRPVNAPITSPFGMRWGRMHTGIDFGAPYGARVGAAGRGTVSFAGWNSGGYGYLVIVQHRLGYQTWYAHLSRISASPGQYVVGGTRIGYVGATGHATGPHLHFEVRHNGVPINPMPYLLSGTAPRLLATPFREDPDGCAPASGPGRDPRTARLVSCK